MFEQRACRRDRMRTRLRSRGHRRDFRPRHRTEAPPLRDPFPRPRIVSQDFRVCHDPGQLSGLIGRLAAECKQPGVSMLWASTCMQQLCREVVPTDYGGQVGAARPDVCAACGGRPRACTGCASSGWAVAPRWERRRDVAWGPAGSVRSCERAEARHQGVAATEPARRRARRDLGPKSAGCLSTKGGETGRDARSQADSGAVVAELRRAPNR